MLRLDSVMTAFGRHGPLSAEVAAGSIVAVVGPTGVGKTSLLRALLGLSPLRAGCIYWGGEPIEQNGVGPSERPFAWVPQDAPIVGDTLAINVGLGRADDDAQVPDPAPFLRRLGAESLASRESLAGLSGGERQWVAVARALASGQPALLLDEPTSALDPAGERRLLAALAELRGEYTVIIVTHRTAPLAIADKVLRLDARYVDDGARADADRVGGDQVAVDDDGAARGEAQGHGRR
jgi:ABC-type transport system involved in cytochrome bd biosynthesis fused ATPase/permease subunit